MGEALWFDFDDSLEVDELLLLDDELLLLDDELLLEELELLELTWFFTSFGKACRPGLGFLRFKSPPILINNDYINKSSSFNILKVSAVLGMGKSCKIAMVL